MDGTLPAAGCRSSDLYQENKIILLIFRIEKKISALFSALTLCRLLVTPRHFMDLFLDLETLLSGHGPSFAALDACCNQRVQAVHPGASNMCLQGL